MASRQRLSALAAAAQTLALAELLDGGDLLIYSGAQPDRPEDGLAGQILLASCRFAEPAFQYDGDGGSHAYPMTDPNARGGGEAAWFRCRTRDGRAVVDGSVGTEEADLVLSRVEIPPHAVVAIDRFTLRSPREESNG